MAEPIATMIKRSVQVPLEKIWWTFRKDAWNLGDLASMAVKTKREKIVPENMANMKMIILRTLMFKSLSYITF